MVDAVVLAVHSQLVCNGLDVLQYVLLNAKEIYFLVEILLVFLLFVLASYELEQPANQSDLNHLRY